MKKILLLAGVINLLSGCAIKSIHDTMQDVETDAATANSLARNKPTESFKISNKIWVQTQPILEKKKQQNPLLNCNITQTKKSLSLSQFVERISAECGVVVRVTQDAWSYTRGDMTGAASQSLPSNVPAPILPDLPSSPVPSMSASQMSQPVSVPSGGMSDFTVQYYGKLSGFLDLYTSGIGLYWRSNPDNGIEIYYLDKQVFPLEAIAATVNSSSNVETNNSSSSGVANNNGGGISGSGGSTQSIQQQIKYDLIANVESTLKQLVSPNVGQFSISPATGTVVVTDTPTSMRYISDYLAKVNSSTSQQVKFGYAIYSVALNKGNNLALDMNVMFNQMNKWSGGLISEGNDFGGSQGTISWNSGRFDGTKLMVRALSEQGKVSLVQTGTLSTANWQPVPVEIYNQKAYLQSSQSTPTADVGVTTALTPGTVTTGFNMTLLPSIVPNTRDVWVYYNLKLTELLEIGTVKSGDSMLQTPDLSGRGLSQILKLRAGESQMISSVVQTQKSGDARGAGSAWNFLFGGEWSNKDKVTVLVSVITPYLE